MDFKRDEYVHEIFEQLHAIPEIGYKEMKTSAFLAQKLEEFGYKVTRNVGTTGILGVLDSGVEGKNFALRSDIDALRYEIDGQEVFIHACGHDANASMTLTAAKYAAEKGIKKGKLTILFQQAEEKVGAVQMIETGLLDDIDEMIGIHLRPIQEAVLGQVTPAMYTGASYFLEMEINGLTSHGARPQLGVNAIDIANSIITGVNSIKEDSRTPYSVKPTQIRSVGNEKNSIPDKVILNFDIRAQNNEVADSIISKVKNIANTTAELFGGKIDGFKQKGVPAADHDAEMVEMTRQAVVDVMGQAMPDLYVTGGEDFAYYPRMLKIKTAYVGVGANIEKGLHHPEMTFDHKALDIGSAVLKRIIDLKFS